MVSLSTYTISRDAPRKVITPQRGFQERVLSCNTDLAIVGGAAGCGKSWCTLVDPLRYIEIPDFNAIIFRRTYPEIVGAGSLWEESRRLYPYFGGQPNQSRLDWRFPSGATIEFSHLQREGDKYSHQGQSYALIIFEELTHFTEGQFWYLHSRNRSLCGIRPYMRATCNPDADSFAAKLVEWWIDKSTGYPIPERAGVPRWFIREGDNIIWRDSREAILREYPNGPTPQSFTFLPGSIEDNVILCTRDPEYVTKLENQPLVDRERLLKGNWLIKPSSGLYFQRGYFSVVDSVDPSLFENGKVVRFWDKAATEKTKSNDPSWTAGVKMARLSNGKYAILHVERFRGSPSTVDERMRNIAQQDGIEVEIGCFQDPGQAGIVDMEHTRRVLDGYKFTPYKVQKDKVTMAGPVSSQAEGGNIILAKGEWNDPYLNELTAFPTPSAHNDQVDATSGAYQLLQAAPLFFAFLD